VETPINIGSLVLNSELLKQLKAAVIGSEPNNALLRHDLQAGKEIPGTVLVKYEKPVSERRGDFAL